MPDELGRRDVIRRLAVLCAAPALARCATAGVDEARVVAVPDPVNNVLQVALAQAPELGKDGGSVVLQPQSHTQGRYPPAVLVVAQGTSFLAMDATCPHAGCYVGWSQGDKLVECPCHGSRFSTGGQVVNGPAQGGLTVFAATSDGTTLRVQLA